MASRTQDPRFPVTLTLGVIVFVIATAVLVVIDKLSRLLNLGAVALVVLGIAGIIYGVVTKNKVAGRNTSSVGMAAIAIGGLTFLVTAMSGLLWKLIFVGATIVLIAVVIRSINKRAPQPSSRVKS